jgi:hypothetical protein
MLACFIYYIEQEQECELLIELKELPDHIDVIEPAMTNKPENLIRMVKNGE